MPVIDDVFAFAPLDDGHVARRDEDGWGFAALLLVVGSLFIRPTDLLPQLRDVPVYQFLIIIAMLLSYRAIGWQLNQHLLALRPATACVLMLVGAVALSHLGNGFFWGARESTWKTIKLVALFLLISGVVNTSQRLEWFARWLVVVITSTSALALADLTGWLDLTALTPIADGNLFADVSQGKLTRIRGSGIFEDPNDLGLAIVIGIALIPYFLFKPNIGWPRMIWILPCIILFWTLILTYSRGAFLALAATVPAWYFFHRGWKAALGGAIVLLPILLTLFAGRMTDFDSVHDGTGQTRIQIWSESLTVFKQSPLLGIGEGMFVEQSGFVCHNSFLQTYTELGFLGGTLFLSVFLTAMVGLLPNRKKQVDSVEQDFVEQEPNAAPIQSQTARLQGAAFVVLVGYSVGILTLSRQFLAPTFLVLGFAVAAHQCSGITIAKKWRLGNTLAIRSATAGIVFLGFTYLFVRLLIRSR